MKVLDRTLFRRFGRTGLEVSCLGFGGSPIGVLGADEDTVASVLNTLLDAGVNVVDTAACYYGSEEMLGRTIGHRRDDYVLISKCGHAKVGDRGDGDFAPDVIRRNIETSLERLRTDHLDVILLHTCDLEMLKQGDALAAAVEARDAGKVRFVGYSGDNETATWAASLDDVAVIQTSVSVCDQVNVDTVLKAAETNGVGIMAKRPVANAAWKTLDEQYERYHNYAGPYHERFARMGLSLEDLGIDGSDAGWPEVFLRFTLSFPGVHTAIVGTTKRDSVLANLAAAAKGPLEPHAVEKIRRAFREADPDGAWEGLT